jgi:hypothetical protein
MEEKKERSTTGSYYAVSKKLCKFGCGISIRFDPAVVSNQRMIPLNLDNTPHRCPNRMYKNDSVRTCNYCGGRITFHEDRKARSGRKIPLNPDDTIHDCKLNPFNQAKKERTIL